MLEAFSLVAWVRHEHADRSSGAAAFVLRKPLGASTEQRARTCWGWRVGSLPQLVFGAHDLAADYSDTSVQEVSVAATLEVGRDGTATGWNDGDLHLEAIVVTQDSVAFYQDGELRSTRPLPRPVTDCSTTALEMGDVGLQLGEVTSFARALSASEISEIMFAGFPFGAIAAGRLPRAPTVSSFDLLRSELQATLAAQDEDAGTLSDTVAINAVLSRADESTDDNVGAELVVPIDEPCDDANGHCYVLRGANETLTADADLEGRAYYALMAPYAEASAGDARGRWYVDNVDEGFGVQFPHFEPASFPSWRGGSVSFSLWARVDDPGYLISKHLAFEKPACWNLYLLSSGATLYGGASWLDPDTNETVTAPTEFLVAPDDWAPSSPR